MPRFIARGSGHSRHKAAPTDFALLALVGVLALLPASARAAAPSLVSGTLTTTTWHDNATNADRAADIVGALEFT